MRRWRWRSMRRSSDSRSHCDRFLWDTISHADSQKYEAGAFNSTFLFFSSLLFLCVKRDKM